MSATPLRPEEVAPPRPKPRGREGLATQRGGKLRWSGEPETQVAAAYTHVAEWVRLVRATRWRESWVSATNRRSGGEQTTLPAAHVGDGG